MTNFLEKVTLRQLQIFLIAAENLSFITAAEILNLTPPAISMQMSRLSESLGIALFEKNGRHIILTEAGKKLLPYARQIMQSLYKVSEELDVLQGLRLGTVKLAMVTTSRNFGPQLIASFNKRHPEITVDIEITNRQNVIEKLESKEIDLALMGRPPARLPVESHSFSDHPYVIIANPGHPFVKLKTIEAQKLLGEKFLIREKGSGTRMIFEHFFKDKKMRFPDTKEMSSNENIKQAVMANMGLAFISEHTIHLELKNRLLKVLPVEGMPQIRTWYILHLQGIQLSPAAQIFKQFVIMHGTDFMKKFFS